MKMQGIVKTILNKNAVGGHTLQAVNFTVKESRQFDTGTSINKWTYGGDVGVRVY